MVAWGNALGGYKRQPRNKRGQFGTKPGKKRSNSFTGKISAKRAAKKKALKRNTTISRKNGTTYETRHVRGLFGGYTVETKAYHKGEFRGSVQGYHGKKTSTVDFLYVAKAHRGTGVSKGLISRQVYHAKRHGLSVTSASERSDGAEKFLARNAIAGAKIIVPKRAAMSSREITEIMEDLGNAEARRHARQYAKQQKRR